MLISGIAYFKISASRAKEILRYAERAVAGWRKAGHALGMTGGELEQFVEAFAHPEGKAAQQVAR
ncbi:MAG: hypothetical protein ABI222_03630 [Opitutaceae bacterium]